jgi:predicted DNA-binding WGR domain protein
MDSSTDRDVTQPTLRLHRVRPEKNERRFYAMAVTQDLFGNAFLLRNWGRIGTGGRLRWDPCPNLTAAAASLRDLARRKRRRGYQDLW